MLTPDPCPPEADGNPAFPGVSASWPDLTGTIIGSGGIDPQHPDIKGRVVSFKDFVGGKLADSGAVKAGIVVATSQGNEGP